MSTTFSVKMTDICFPRMENEKKENVQQYKFMLLWQ